jgi:hypothetical protein
MPDIDLDNTTIHLSRLDGETAVRFLYESAYNAGYQAGSNDAARDGARRQAARNHSIAAAMLTDACGADQTVQWLLGRHVRSILNGTPMVSPHIGEILRLLSHCNLNDSRKKVPIHALEAVRDLAVRASDELKKPPARGDT